MPPRSTNVASHGRRRPRPTAPTRTMGRPARRRPRSLHRARPVPPSAPATAQHTVSFGAFPGQTPDRTSAANTLRGPDRSRARLRPGVRAMELDVPQRLPRHGHRQRPGDGSCRCGPATPMARWSRGGRSPTPPSVHRSTPRWWRGSSGSTSASRCGSRSTTSPRRSPTCPMVTPTTSSTPGSGLSTSSAAVGHQRRVRVDHDRLQLRGALVGPAPCRPLVPRRRLRRPHRRRRLQLVELPDDQRYPVGEPGVDHHPAA